MLSNFRKIFLDPLVYRAPEQPFMSQTESRASASDIDYPEQTNDAVAQQHWAIAMAEAETVYIAGCTCAFCSRHTETDDDDADSGDTSTRSPSQSNAHLSLPSTRSMMHVLYPMSYLGTPSPFPDPPLYSALNPARGDDLGISPSTSSKTISRPDPLSQDPSLTGVPSQGTPSSRVPVEPNPPVIAPRGDALEETEPLPAYSRSDQRRPRHTAASGILGPYPPLSALR